MKKIPSNLAFYLLAALHILVVLALYFSQNDFAAPDSSRYIDLANAIGNGHFGLETSRGYENEFLRLPGYPLFLLLIRSIAGPSNAAVSAVQLVLYLLSVWFVYKSVSWNFGRFESKVFLLFSLFYPVLAVDAVYLLPNLMTTFFVSAAVFTVSNPKWLESNYSFAIAGVLFGCAAMQRANIFPFALVLAVTMLIVVKEHRKKTLIMAAALLLVIAPWYIRSYAVSGNISPSSNTVGLETMIYQGSLEARYAAETGVYFRRSHFPESYEEYKSEGIQQQLREIKQELGLKPDDSYFAIAFDLPPEKVPLAKKLLLSHSLKNISTSPLRFVTIGTATILRMWIGKADTSPNTFFYPPGILGMAAGFLIFVFALAGAVLVFWSHEQISTLALICVTSFLFFSVTLGILHSEVRYANPVKLLFLALAAYAIGCIYKFFNREELKDGRKTKVSKLRNADF